MVTRDKKLEPTTSFRSFSDITSLIDAGSDDGPEEMSPFLIQIKERSIGPTNYLVVSKPNAAIQGEYAIDLSMPQLLETATAFHGVPMKNGRKPNLYLETSRGPIVAEVWIIPDVRGKSTQAVLNFTNRSGSIQAKVHCPDTRSGTHPNLDIEILANDGDVSVSLPRCFRGNITIRDVSHDRIAFSPALSACTAPLLDVPEERVYHVRGEMCVEKKTRRGGGGGGGCEGGSGKGRSATREEQPMDVLRVHGQHRAVRINWVGEADLPRKKSRRIRLNLGRWKSRLNELRRDVARLFATSGRAN